MKDALLTIIVFTCATLLGFHCKEMRQVEHSFSAELDTSHAYQVVAKMYMDSMKLDEADYCLNRATYHTDKADSIQKLIWLY